MALLFVAFGGAPCSGADPIPTGARVNGGATAEVYALTVGPRSGVVKVPKESGAAFQRALASSLPDYQLAARLYGGPELYSETLVDVRLPDGRVTRGIFMERIEGLRLDKALETMRVAPDDSTGREAVSKLAGFPVGPDHYDALLKLRKKLVENGHALYDLNTENLFLVPAKSGHLRLVDPTIEDVGKGRAAEKEIAKNLLLVQSELEKLTLPFQRSPGPGGCVRDLKQLAL